LGGASEDGGSIFSKIFIPIYKSIWHQNPEDHHVVLKGDPLQLSKLVKVELHQEGLGL
jgi:hypothetical protein